MSEATETRQGPEGGAAEREVVGLVPMFSERLGPMFGPCVGLESAVRIGRDASVELAIDDSQLSRQHASVTPAARGFAVKDLGSRNGTFVGGERVGPKGMLVPVGSVVRCGRTLLRIVANVVPFRTHGFVGEGSLIGGPTVATLLDLIRSVAPLPHPVLIEGETGTGKELVARALHDASGRRGAWVAVNCGAIPSELLESELFGHARGAFSGSERARAGLFRSADHGTLLLDELGELPSAAQVTLLRAMEQREIRPVGEDRTVPVDVRVVGATNCLIERMVESGRFRADLFHRIAVWRLRVPSLRERIEDVPLLAVHFLEGAPVAFSVEVMERFALHNWPGNVRELRNVVATAAARAQSTPRTQIRIEHLPWMDAAPSPKAASSTVEDVALRARIETALALREGNVSLVAKDLGCGRPWLYLALKRFDIDPASFRKPR